MTQLLPCQINSTQPPSDVIPGVATTELTAMKNVTCIYTHFFAWLLLKFYQQWRGNNF